jgi:hypothetical protein
MEPNMKENGKMIYKYIKNKIKKRENRENREIRDI